jgi:hypothetical protein
VTHLALLDAALEAVVVESKHRFSWFGKRPPALNAHVRRSLAPPDVREHLLTTLVECLYSNFYCPGFASPAEWLGPGASPAGDLSDELSRRNAGTGRWDEGWTVSEVRDGHLRVAKHGLVLAITRDQFRAEGGHAAVAGSSGRTRLPAELRGVSPGFYMALSDRPEPAGAHAVARLYWNVTAAGVPRLTAALTACLNAERLPFHFKALNTTQTQARCDVAVLYFAREDARAVVRHAAQVHAGLAALTRPLTPVFTKRLAPGLAVAEQPDPDTSFGVHRCRLVATGLLAAHERGQRSFDARRSAVIEELERAGLDLAAPHLNPGSTDVYALPVAAGGAAAIPVVSARGARTPAVFLHASDAIGQRLVRDALWHDGRCTWVGAFPSTSPGSQRAAGPDVYSGTAGIGLFLAELAAATGDRAMARTARAALRQSFHAAETVRPFERLGLFSGWPGIAWSAVRAGRAIGDDGLVPAARALVARLHHHLPEPNDADLMSGSAGAIVALAALGPDAGPDAIDLAAALGERLLENAVSEGGASSWRTVNGRGEYDLTGLSHGAAGIGVALAELWALTGEVRYADGARRAFAYEERWFDAGAGNWPDLRGVRVRRRRPQEALPFSNFWCHGAAGIALSRVRAFAVLRDARYLLDARRARSTVVAWLRKMRAGGGVSFSLCHGLAGNAEVLRLVAPSLDADPGSDLALVEDVAWAGVERHSSRADDWPCAAGGGPAHGLMLGLAGIGHFYLRLHDPRKAPVLLPHWEAAGTAPRVSPAAATRELEGGRRCQA